MKSLIRVLAVAALMMLMTASFSGIASAGRIALPSGTTVNIQIQDYQFSPKVANVSVGDTVTWTNMGAVAHTVTASDGSWDSGNLNPGASFSHTFSAIGTVNYYCRYHGSPNGAGMAGTIMVAAEGGATPTSGTAATATPVLTVTPSGPIPSVDARDQPAGSSLTVARVVAAQDGWITIHANTPQNQPGEQLGHSAVKRGNNYNVKVTLNPVPKAGDKVWPMLHIDAGVIGVYEFPGPDAPVILNGNIVMVQITLTTPIPPVRPSATPGQAQATPTAGMTMTPIPPLTTATVGMVMTNTETVAMPTASPIIEPTASPVTMAATPTAGKVMQPTVVSGGTGGNGQPGLPHTGAGDQSALDLRLLITLAALLIGGGVLLRKRRTA